MVLGASRGTESLSSALWIAHCLFPACSASGGLPLRDIPITTPTSSLWLLGPAETTPETGLAEWEPIPSMPSCFAGGWPCPDWVFHASQSLVASTLTHHHLFVLLKARVRRYLVSLTPGPPAPTLVNSSVVIFPQIT